MQIDSTKKIVLLGVKSHTGPPFLEDFLGFEHHTVFRYDEGGLNEYHRAGADGMKLAGLTLKAVQASYSYDPQLSLALYFISLGNP
jgi:hypothetical protein